MMKIDIQNKVEEIIGNLVCKNYEKVYENDFKKHLDADILREAIEDYDGQLTMPKENAFELMTVYKLSDDRFNIDFPLWY